MGTLPSCGLKRHLQIARLEPKRIENHFLAGLLELLHVVALNSPILNQQEPRLSPFAARAEFDVTGHLIERRLADVLGELTVVQRVDALYGGFEDLHLRISIGRNVQAERIDAGSGS